ncbi:hypothetical protein N2152v2_011034 [Parachlorella kessleri]
MAALYALVFLTMPFLRSSLPAPNADAGTTTTAAAAAAGMHGGDSLGQLLPEGGTFAHGASSSRGAARAQLTVVGSRRLALERPAAAQGVEMWPDTGLAQQYGSKTASLPRVEFRDAGYVVALVDALNASRWDEQLLYMPGPIPHPVPQKPTLRVPRKGAGFEGSAAKFPAWCPQSDVRLFIGITSRCASAEAQAKRMAIRRTWMQMAKDRYPDVVIRFILAQPSTEAELLRSVDLLRNEIQQYADIVIVPGVDIYRYLPNKTLQLFKYALSSPCKFTHVMKTDDDVYIRPQKLVDVINKGEYDFSVPVQYDGSGVFDGTRPVSRQAPWMSGMFVGQVDRNESNVYPGFIPIRDPKAKWYLSEEDLPDELAPLGTRWAAGWGYMLSRDLAEFVTNTALMYAAVPSKKPPWWGRMPWEDIMIGAMLRDVARVHHHAGWKAAWQECESDSVLKHLDNDAPVLLDGMNAQELSGLWGRKTIVCSSGIFEPNNYTQWRTWRNSLPDNQIGGYM